MRYVLPLQPDELPTVMVVIMVALVTTFVGLQAGIVTSAVGGLLAWYLFLNPMSWSLAHRAWIPMLGYALVVFVMIATAYFFRNSERLHYQRDQAELRAQAEQARFFARELAHRLGNTLAIVQSIAAHTFTRGLPEGKIFSDRINALAAANALLSEDIVAPTATVEAVVLSALKPFVGEDPDRLSLHSVDARIASQQVLILSLAIHELATNALKYGALSAPSGSIALKIEEAGDDLRLAWHERDGPPVVPPQRSGFGTKLLQRAVAVEALEFEPAGLRCSLIVRKAAPGDARPQP